MSKLLREYKNGKALITLYQDGTRVIKGSDFDFPLNIDIRVSTQCSFGQREDGSFVLCHFCHESAQVKGKHCDFSLLKQKLEGLPPIELAIGCNEFTDELYTFLESVKEHFVCNLTVNSGHLKRDKNKILSAIDNKLIYGLGVSYRSLFSLPNWVLDYDNTVIHVIAGIDDFDNIKNLTANKILVLGCKDFGFNLGKVNQEQLVVWKRRIYELFHKHLCFDNLALEQLDIKRFFDNETWDIIYQGEESFYIDAVNQRISSSSRTNDYIDWDKVSLKDYYKEIISAKNKIKSV